MCETELTPHGVISLRVLCHLCALCAAAQRQVTKEPVRLHPHAFIFLRRVCLLLEVVAVGGYDVARGNGCLLAEAIERTPILRAMVLSFGVGNDLMSYAVDFYDDSFHTIPNFLNSFVIPNAAAPPRIISSTTPAPIFVFCHHVSGRGTSLMTG